MTKEMQIIYNLLKEKYNVTYKEINEADVVICWEKNLKEGCVHAFAQDNESVHFFQDDKEYMNYGILTENYGLVLGMGIDISIFSQAEANELIQEMESNCGSDFHCNIKNIVNDFLNSPNIKIFGKEQN
ncbi:MAG: hypothetical protein LUI06_04835 [Ruminococcus sp.]|nr:hypothetical protein [Ruminococcus sp.]